MSAFENLIKAHKPLGIYNIKEDSNIGIELAAYAAGLDMICAELEELEQECFVHTAGSFGLSLWEKLWGNARDDLDVSKRREMILARMCFGYEDFTLEGMSKVIRFLGINGTIREYPRVYRVTVEIEGALTEGQRNWVSSQIKAVFPAHIEADAVFAGFDWNALEGKNLTFDNMEQRLMQWEDIDIYVQ